ncbi:MAG: glycosyltransferase family 4 protein [Lentimicrobium sp.]
MRKILFIHHATGWGGAPNSLIKLIQGLDKSVYKVEVLLLKDSIVSEKLNEYGIKYSVAESYFYRKIYHYFTHSEACYVKWYQIIEFCKLTLFWLLSRYIFAKMELKKHDFDIVHLNSSVLTDWLAPARKRGKVVIQIREPFRRGKFDFLNLFLKFQMKRFANRIIAISSDNAMRINILDKTTVIYNFSEIQNIDVKDESYRSRSVLYLGGAQNIKGFSHIVNALDHLNNNVKVYFCGDYVHKERKENLANQIFKILRRKKWSTLEAIKKISNHNNVHYVGLVNNVEDYYANVCCLVSPFSVPHFSRPVIESYLQKKPVIATDIEGIEEIVIHGITGIIVKKNDPVALANAINNLTSDPLLAQRMGLKGYEFAVNRFTTDNIRKYEDLYESLVK